MDLSSKRIFGIDEDWNALLSSGYLQDGDSHDGITYVTDGKKWGAKDWQGNPLIPIKYDSVIYEEFAYGWFHFVCINDEKVDVLDGYGKPKSLGLKLYDNRDFDPVRYFICLANSYKRGGRCIAGIEVDCNNNAMLNNNGNPRWMRPIADTLYGEIPNHIANNIKMLSLVRIIDGLPCPKDAHRENLSYTKMEVCSLHFPANSALLNQLVDNVHQSVFGNRGKAVSADKASELDYSLMFVHVQNAGAYIDENREKSKNRMSFTYYGTDYDFPITDPIFLDEFKKEPDRYAIIPDVYLTLSLGLEFEGWHHKLVAGVIIPYSSHSHDVEDISYMEQQKSLHINAYAKWTPEDDSRLKELYLQGISVQELTQIFGRNEGAIYSRISKLGLEDERVVSQQTDNNWFDKYDQELARLLDKRNEIDEQINEVRAKILEQMESHGLEKIHSEQFSVSYTPAKTVMQFDSRTFRTENEELYTRYCKPKQREKSIVVKRNLNR